MHSTELPPKKQASRLHPIKIGNVVTDNNVFLAPMAGVTDLPFRLLCKEQGCGLVTTEMISAKGISHHNVNTQALLAIDPRERPCAVQLFGSDPGLLAATAAAVEDAADIIDLNMGCPAPKIVQNGEGSALMKNPALIGSIVRRITDTIHKPVTVKIRQGFDASHVNAVEVAKIAEQAGAAAVAVHGRTREQFYSGRADWGVIAAVKAAVGVPVLGNGDVDGGPAALAMLEQTGCDGVLVARGAAGNPWIFREIIRYLSEGVLPEAPSDEEKMKSALRHLHMLIACKGEHLGILEMRKHMSWYVKGLPHASLWRNVIHRAGSVAHYENIAGEIIAGKIPGVYR